MTGYPLFSRTKSRREIEDHLIAGKGLVDDPGILRIAPVFVDRDEERTQTRDKKQEVVDREYQILPHFSQCMHQRHPVKPAQGMVGHHDVPSGRGDELRKRGRLSFTGIHHFHLHSELLQDGFHERKSCLVAVAPDVTVNLLLVYDPLQIGDHKPRDDFQQGGILGGNHRLHVDQIRRDDRFGFRSHKANIQTIGMQAAKCSSERFILRPSHGQWSPTPEACLLS